MSSDLERTRDHARRMAIEEHTDTCRERRAAWLLQASKHARFPRAYREPKGPEPTCTSCVTPADRLLWIQIANEIDAHLAQPVDQELPL